MSIEIHKRAIVKLVRMLVVSVLITNIVLCFVLPEVIVKAADAMRSIIAYVCPSCLQWVSYQIFYVMVFVMANIIVITTVIYCRRQHLPQIRNIYHLNKVMSQNRERSPAVDIDSLMERTLGSEICKKGGDDYDQVRGIVMENVSPIIDFLDGGCKYNNTLIVSAPWGAGKTTSTLVALNLRDISGQKIYRYVYESAFKYTDNTGEFGRDVTAAIFDVLAELNISSTEDFDNLLQNISFEPANFLQSIFKVFQQNPAALTTDLVSKINERYFKYIENSKNLPLDLTIVIDDLDRLQGEDAVNVLSLLSIIRRFSFVRIIIPVDPTTVSAQLGEAHIYQPEKFIQKYLPEQSTVELKSTAEIIEIIARQNIKGLQKKLPEGETGFCAAWAAIIIKLVSNRLNRTPGELGDRTFQWLNLDEGGYGRRPIPQDAMSPRLWKILTALSENIDNQVLRKTNEYGKKYKWLDSSPSDARKVEDFILKVLCRDSTRAMSDFTEDMYYDLIAPWIFSFAKEYWSDIDATLRDVLDIIHAHDFSNLDEDLGRQFKQVMAQLFPDSMKPYL